MKHPIPVLLSFVVLTLASSSANAVAWSIIDLGSAHNANTMALNDNGWVVLGTKVLNPNGAGGYTTTQLFNAQGNDNNFALYDINNSNSVVGIDRNSGSVQGFVWSDGNRTNLPTVPNLYNYPVAEAKSINDSGQVGGNAGDTAAIWSPNGSGYGVTPLGWYWEGNSFGSGDGVSINNNGFGLMATVYNTYRPGYTNGLGLGITILGDGLISQPMGLAINDRYAVAGYGTYNCSGYGCNSPFIWTSGNDVAFLPITAVDSEWAYNGKAYALNEDNDVVGMGWYDAYDGRAVLWSASDSGWLETDLNSVIPVDSNFRKLTEARDINEKGQILGMGAVDGDWQPHAFLLTPAVPEPETWVMLLAGLGLTLLRSRLH